MSEFLFTRKIPVVLFALALGACSSEPAPGTPSPPPGSGGSSGSGGAGGSVAPVAGTGGAAGSGGIAGGGGSAGDAGSAGSAGAAGSAGSGGGSGGGDPTKGTQLDPGTDGDGIFPQPGPYDQLPPEALSHIDGAPEGAVTGPFKYTQTGTYTDWDQWQFTWYVYVPAQYQPGHRAALMVFQDGYIYSGITDITDSRFNTPTVFDNLIHEGSMPVTIAVFLFCGKPNGEQAGGGDPDRAIQYDSPNDQYGKFLTEEFLPNNILNQWDIVTDPDGWAIGGHSSGGIASIIAGWYYPDKFRKMLTASPSFPNRGGVFPDEFLTEPTPKPLRIYHLSGTADIGSFYEENNNAADIFEQLGYHFRYRQGEDQHYPPKAAMADYPDALRWLWRGYSTPP